MAATSGDDRRQGRSLSLPPQLSWSCPSDVTTTDKNEPPKIQVIWEELSCLPAHYGGSLEAVAMDAKILYKEKELFLVEMTYSKDHGVRIYLF